MTPLKALLNPDSVAVIGASDDPDKVGGRPIHFLRENGYPGRIYPVNVRKKTVQGLQAHNSVAALPETPDCAVIALPADASLEALAACIERGVPAAILMASGFGEEDSPEARERQRKLDVLISHGVTRVVGPNSLGFANVGNGAILTFSTMFTDEDSQDGRVALISQSGAMCSIPFGLLREQGVGARYVLATGNDSDVTVAEAVEAVSHDPEIDVVFAYVENFAQASLWAEASQRLKARHGALCLMHAGWSDAGQRAAQSHTGALSSEGKVVSAFLQKYGIVECLTVQDFMDIAPLVLAGYAPRLSPNVGAVSNSGALCVLAADAIERHGLKVSQLEIDSSEALGRALPGYASTVNPVDVTSALLTDSSIFSKVLPVMAADPAVDVIVLAIPVAGRGYDVPRFAQDARRVATSTGIPVIVAVPQRNVQRAFEAVGLPSYTDVDAAVGAIARCLRASGPEPVAALSTRVGTGSTQATALDEVRSFSLLEKYGIPVPDLVSITTRIDLEHSLESAAEDEYVLKGIVPGVVHKSEHGLVDLKVKKSELLEAYDRMVVGSADKGLELERCYFTTMQQGRAELLIGAKRDPVVGPVVVVGRGGTDVEVDPDVVTLIAPVTYEEARRAIDSLRFSQFLDSFRGKGPADVEVAARALVATSELMEAEVRVRALDINPFLLRDAGSGGCAVDAVVIVDEEVG